MAHEEDSLEGYKRAVHCAVLQANDSGAPSAQTLDQAPGDSGQGAQPGASTSTQLSEQLDDKKAANKSNKRVCSHEESWLELLKENKQIK